MTESMTENRGLFICLKFLNTDLVKNLVMLKLGMLVLEGALGKGSEFHLLQ